MEKNNNFIYKYERIELDNDNLYLDYEAELDNLCVDIEYNIQKLHDKMLGYSFEKQDFENLMTLEARRKALLNFLALRYETNFRIQLTGTKFNKEIMKRKIEMAAALCAQFHFTHNLPLIGIHFLEKFSNDYGVDLSNIVKESYVANKVSVK